MNQRPSGWVQVLRRMAIVPAVTILLLRLSWAQEARRPPETAAIEKEVIEIEDLKNEAMQKGNSEALEKIYADDLMFINAKGQFLTKQDRLTEFKSGNVKYLSFWQGGYQLHVYGDTVIVTGYACSVVDYHGAINRIPRRFTSVYVRLDGRWRFAAHQATLVSAESGSSRGLCDH